jgi:putative DNA primase/helicase
MRRHDIPEDILRDVGVSADEFRYAVTPLRRFRRHDSPPKFPTDALPRPVARLVEESAAAIGCPPDAIGLSALIALGSAIGNSRVIQPKKGWTESAAIYGAVIADSGEKKTAAIAAAASEVQRIENSLNKQHDQEMDEFAREEREYEVDRKEASKQGLPAPPPPRRPIAERVHVNDTTVEALVPILKENPRGVMLERDELVGWVKGMDQYKAGGKGSDRQFWLSVWSNRPVSVDRKGQSGPTSVLRPFVSVVGSIQPSVLPELAGNREDGMLERFLFAYPETLNAMWTEDEVSDTAKAAYQDLYERLRDLGMEADELGDPIEKPVTFSTEAKQLYIATYNTHRRDMGLSGFPSFLRSPFSKLEAYLLRITLILAACRFATDSVAERVEVDDVLRAVALVEYFKEQTRRVFGALGGFDPRNRLVEDCSRFVSERGGSWKGTATELHEELVSDFKPDRPDELSKFLKDAAEHVPGFVYESETERFKDAEGEWKSRRILTLSEGNRRNGVTA